MPGREVDTRRGQWNHSRGLGGITAALLCVLCPTIAHAHGVHGLPSYVDQGLAFVFLGAERMAGAIALGLALASPAPWLEKAPGTPIAASLKAGDHAALSSQLSAHVAVSGTGVAAVVLFLLAFVVGLSLGFETALLFLDVSTPALLVSAGGMLLAAGWSRLHWLLIPFASVYGLLLGTQVFLDGPADAAWQWFALGSAVGALVQVAAVRVGIAQWGPYVRPIAFQIIGSWLVAAALMLAALNRDPVGI